jgi:hypothetical protein
MSGFGDGRELAKRRARTAYLRHRNRPGGRNLAHKQKDSAANVFDLPAF